MTKKVLFIIHLPPPVHGGAMVGKYIRESSLINDGLDADYINLSTSANLDEIGKGGFGKVLSIVKLQFRVLRALMTRRYDLCYVTLTAKGAGFYKDFLMVMILKMFNKSIIYHLHNKGVSEKQNQKIDDLLYRFTYKHAKVILLSPLLYQDISKYVDSANVFICPNGTAPVLLQHSASAAKVSSPFRLLFFSNMIAEKGVWILLEACKILHERGYSIICNFVGAWSDVDENAFNNRVKAYGLPEVVYAHGKQYGEDKQAFFNDADIFVFPTFYHNECFPLVLLEAMSHALPIITTAEGAIADIVEDGITGCLIPKQDPQALASKIEACILQKVPYQEMGLQGKKRFEERFALSNFEKNMRSILMASLNSN